MIPQRLIPRSLLTGRRIAAVEVVFTGDSTVFRLSQMRVKRGFVVIEFSRQYGDQNDCVKAIKSGLPIVLVFSGQGFLLKELQTTGSESSHDLISQQLPGVDLSANYMQVYDVSDTLSYAVLTKKQRIEGVVDGLGSDRRKMLAGIYIGPVGLLSLRDILLESPTLDTGSYRLVATGGTVTKITSHKLDISQSEDSLPTNIRRYQLAGFAAGISHFSGQNQCSWESPEFQLISTKFRERKMLKTVAVGVVAFFAFFSFSNAVISAAYFRQLEEVASAVEQHETRFKHNSANLKELTLKQAVLNQVALQGPTHHSYYSDQVAMTVPSEITLGELQISPPYESSFLKDTLLGFEQKKVMIKGFCQHSYILNEWIRRLRQLQFVKEAALEEFSIHEQKFRPNFLISLKLK